MFNTFQQKFLIRKEENGVELTSFEKKEVRENMIQYIDI